MPRLTEKLRNDHAAILVALEELRVMGTSHPKFPRKATLTKAALVAHLAHEEEELYPVLKKAAETDFAIQAKLNVLLKDLEGLSRVAMNFFKAYENGGDEVEFSTDLHNLTFALKTRIRREEQTLYFIYDELMSKKAS